MTCLLITETLILRLFASLDLMGDRREKEAPRKGGTVREQGEQGEPGEERRQGGQQGSQCLQPQGQGG